MNLEHRVFSELVNEGFPLPQFVIVSEHSLKQAGKEMCEKRKKHRIMIVIVGGKDQHKIEAKKITSTC